MKNPLNILLAVAFMLLIAGCLEQEEKPQKSIPDVLISVDSYSPPAYRGNSTIVNLVISGIDVRGETEISLNYITEMVHTDGSLESAPEGIQLNPERKPLIFKRTAKAEEKPEKLYSNLTIVVDKNAADGDYYITVGGKNKGLVFGSPVLYFKIGKGRKLLLPKKNVWNIGYTRGKHPPLSEEEKNEAVAIVNNLSYLNGTKYQITRVSSEFYEYGNFSGFFPQVEVYRGYATEPHIVDLEEKKIVSKVLVINTPPPKIVIFTLDYVPYMSNHNHPSIGREKTTLINLTISAYDISKGTRLYLNYSVYARYPDGYTEVNPKEVNLFVAPKVVVFQEDCLEGCKLRSSLTVYVSPAARQGDYLIDFGGEANGIELGAQGFFFVLGK